MSAQQQQANELALALKRAERQDADVMLARTVAAARGATPNEIQRAVHELEEIGGWTA